jgi:hypothetical protein
LNFPLANFHMHSCDPFRKEANLLNVKLSGWIVIYC